LEKEKTMEFSVYFRSQESGEHLRRLIESTGIGCVRDCQDLGALTEVTGVDVILLEYQDNNPCLDRWITQTAGNPGCPEIFLFVQEVSPSVIWKAIKLGARELINSTTPPEDFQNAVKRVAMRHATLAGPDSDLAARPTPIGSKTRLQEQAGWLEISGLLVETDRRGLRLDAVLRFLDNPKHPQKFLVSYQGGNRGEDSFGKPGACVALVAETFLPPQDLQSRAQVGGDQLGGVGGEALFQAAAGEVG
jgi:hypothetical protein